MSRVFLVFFAFLSIYTHQGCGGAPEPTAETVEETTTAPTTAVTTKAAVAGSTATDAPAAVTTEEPPAPVEETVVDTGYGYGFGMMI
jgi:hypothetical protein